MGGFFRGFKFLLDCSRSVLFEVREKAVMVPAVSLAVVKLDKAPMAVCDVARENLLLGVAESLNYFFLRNRILFRDYEILELMSFP